MKLKCKKINISTSGPLIAILNIHDADELDVTALDRIKIKKGKSSVIVAIDIANDNKEIKKGQIGLFKGVQAILKIKDSETVEIEQIQRPNSLYYIKGKLDGKELNEKEMDEIIKDLVENRLTEVESSYFVSACYRNGMTLDESKYLTNAIVRYGGHLNIGRNVIVDKHCIGGIPANRTTMIVVPIVAAAGLTIPKTSTRAITSVSGTADTVEVLAPVGHKKEDIEKIVKRANGCMVWGGVLDLASADDKLIKLERPLSLDPEGILLASILSKKIAVGSKHVLIDIPIGPEAKIKTRKKAEKLKNSFKKLGKKLGLNIKVIITSGFQPIGNGIGPTLEARDVLMVLQNRINAPQDLRKKGLYMAALLMSMVGIKNSLTKATEILESGLAYRKMQEIIKLQGGDPNIRPEDLKPGKYNYEIKSEKTGHITIISNNSLTRIGKAAGAPQDKSAGIYLYKKLKDRVNKDETVLKIYAENKDKLKNAIDICKKCKIFKVN